MNPTERQVVGSRGRFAVAKWQPVAILVIAAIVVIAGLVKVVGPIKAESAVKSKQYQALFLTNGQVYFGKLSNVTHSYVKLTDIYYLQVQQQGQPQGSNAQAQPQVSLAKLGSELHGPEDVMYVNRDQVLFWENLKDDGKVVTAIKNHQNSK